MDLLAINSTTAVAGNFGFTLASAATAVVEFMAKWLNMYPLTVFLDCTKIEPGVTGSRVLPRTGL